MSIYAIYAHKRGGDEPQAQGAVEGDLNAVQVGIIPHPLAPDDAQNTVREFRLT